MFTNGGEGGESQITQQTCEGEVGGSVGVQAGYHAGRCGYMNVFHYNSNSCQIDNIPQ